MPNPPVANGDSTSATPGVAVTIDVAANDSDPDGDLVPTSVSVQTGPSQGTTSVYGATGVVTYTPNANVNRLDSFTYQVCDTTAGSAPRPR